jgi:2-polyprenyl-3-methyl-5-hydroxy-6-metoxy-1,4-benzoquinol methylase
MEKGCERMKRDQNLNDSLINMGLKKGEAPSSFNYLLPVITKILGGSKFPRKILDIGCGNGALADFLSKTDN